MTEVEYRAIVQEVIRDGKHGPFVVARHPDLGSITFLLCSEVWQESREPKPGSEIIVSDVWKKRLGWRAEKARFLRPSDQTATSKTARSKQQ